MLSKLIKSNFKNDLSHMITFFLIMTLSVFMLHTGIMILLGYSGLHQQKVDDYNLSDMVVLSALKPADKEAIEEIVSTSDDIEFYEKTYPVQKTFTVEKGDAADGESKNAYDSKSYTQLVEPYGGWGDIEAPHFVELSDEEFENPIYISVYSNTNLFKAKLGDSIDMKVDDKYYTFQVAGIFENILGSACGTIYVDPSLYERWRNEAEEKMKATQRKLGMDDTEPFYTMTVFQMKLKEGTDSVEAAGSLSKAFSEHDINAYAQGVDEIILALVYMQNMIAALLSAFALVIATIAMIIIYFRISNSIEQNITNIGALKSLGYTSRQIRHSMVIEFTATAGVAFLTGIGLSYMVIPVFEQMMRSFSAVVWDHKFDVVSFGITAILILGTVVLVSFISTRSIKKLDPVIALRFGVNEKNYKRNHAPIEYTPGPLPWVMGLKSLLGNVKQNVILFVVMLSIGFVTTFSVFLFYNCVSDPSHLYRMLNLVGSDVTLQVDDKNAIADVGEIPEVESVWWLDTADMTLEGYGVYATVAEDWSVIGEVNIYEGRYPIYDNEIALGGALAKTLHVGVGDEVNISYGKLEKRYTIVGLEQSAANFGKDISITEEGAAHLGYEPYKGNIELFVKNHGLNESRNVVSMAEDMYGDRLLMYGNAIETLATGEDQIIAIAAIMVFIMVVICILVIVLSMNLLVKTLIIKKQKEIGIKKAIGFSSRQLRAELVLSMLPQIGIGATAGAVLGCASANPVLASLLSSLGIIRSNMEVFTWMGIIAVIFTLIVSFVMIWLLSGRIRRISAYNLITE